MWPLSECVRRYSFVFPNTALVTATLAVGKSLDTSAIQIFGTVLAVLVVVIWIFVFYKMIRALYLRRLLWPVQADEANISRKGRAENRREAPRHNPHRNSHTVAD